MKFPMFDFEDFREDGVYVCSLLPTIVFEKYSYNEEINISFYWLFFRFSIIF